MSDRREAREALVKALREVRLRLAENRIILTALVRSLQRREERRHEETPRRSRERSNRPIRRPDGTWVWPKSKGRGGGTKTA